MSGKEICYLFMLGIFIINNTQARIIQTSRSAINLKILNRAPTQRNLRGMSKEVSTHGYEMGTDSVTISKEEFVNKYQSFKKNKKTQMDNIFISRRRMEGLKPIEEDFATAMKDFESYNEEYKVKEDGGVYIISDDAENPLFDVRMEKMEDKSDDEHNINFYVENFKYKGEFEKKMMKGLSIIESAENHRDKIYSFIKESVDDIVEQETADEHGTQTQTLAEIAGELKESVMADTGLEPVIEDEEFGYLYELRSNDDMKYLLAIMMVYPVAEKIFMIKVQSRLMEQFELQVTNYLKMQDRNALGVELVKIITPLKEYKSIEASQIAEKINGMFTKAQSDSFFKDLCTGSGSVNENAYNSFLPGVVFFEYENGEINASGEDGKPSGNCFLDNGQVSLIDIMDMPYIYLRLVNNKITIENFIPAIHNEDALEQLETALSKFMEMNQTIEENVIKQKLDKSIPETSFDSLKELIKQETSGLPLEVTEEEDALYLKEGNIPRLTLKNEMSYCYIKFNFPNNVFKDKDQSAPLTNEFRLSHTKLGYNVDELFKETLQKFVELMKQ